MDDHNHPTRSIGDYEVGPIIGSGSFSVVRRSTHKKTGKEVAIKEIKKKKILNPKVSENLLKEISVLDTINHPNIIRLYEAFETEETIYIVLEYCDGGDLGEYITRHGRVSEDVARHFIKQLAAGLQVLQEKHLIHRDLKPQNLLLSTNNEYPQLKIGDFGFVRSLPSEDMANTLCGSPLYMAPEIIQHQKYDAKADLWSVGTILFQLVTGTTPFSGNCQLQLFQNILSSTEVQFPEGALEQLHLDCVDLCRSLLRRNPVERLSFKEFFNHKFLDETRIKFDFEHSSELPYKKSGTEQVDSSTFDRMPTVLEHPHFSAYRNTIITKSSVPDMVSQGQGCVRNPDDESAHESTSKSGDSIESIEKDYVLVNRHSASEENFSFCFDKSLGDSFNARVSLSLPKKSNNEAIATSQMVSTFGACAEHRKTDGLNQLSASSAVPRFEKAQTSSSADPSTRLELLHQYVLEVAELAQEKYDAGLLLESFSVELVILAMWKNIHQLWTSRLASVEGSTVSEKSDNNSSLDSMWVEQGFFLALERADKLSCHVQEMDASAEVPDGMELIFKRALAFGTSGAVHEYMGNKSKAAASYSKAMLLLSFILNESTALQLKPPFSLTPMTRNRIQSYIDTMQSHQSSLNVADIKEETIRGIS